MRRLRTGVPHARATEISPSRIIAQGSLRIVIDGSDSVAVFVEDAESITHELLHRSKTKSWHGFARPRSTSPRERFSSDRQRETVIEWVWRC
jgi:hypothetical protein